MSSKCDEKCFLCQHEFQQRRHRHLEGWSEAVCSFLVQESGLTIGKSDVVCVCEACNMSLRKALNAKSKGEPYHLRWLSSKMGCCVPATTLGGSVVKWVVVCQLVHLA